MSDVFVHGIGAVSPAGWGVPTLNEAVAANRPVPLHEEPPAAAKRPLRARRVPSPHPRPAFLNHPRLRRSSPISHFAVAATLEALGADATAEHRGGSRLGLVFCTTTGCVNYSRRFYDETLRNPATASPLLFPETVFNAPASHLASLVGATELNYTMVGDPATFLQAIAVAANWLAHDQADGAVVIGAEEFDWLTAEASELFDSRVVIAEGAGAVYLKRERPPGDAITLEHVTEASLFADRAGQFAAARRTREALGAHGGDGILASSLVGVPGIDAAESAAWQGWAGTHIQTKPLLGEGLMAGAAWQCVAALAALGQAQARSAIVNIVGCHQAVGAARFARRPAPRS